MGTLIDFTGKKFGRLTVLERVPSHSYGGAWWKCLCTCGKVLDVVSTNLQEGHTKSCGCLKNRRRDLAGQIFGRLTVLERAEDNKYGESQWVCLCVCGKKKTVKSGSLRSGNTRSCGCLHDEWLRTRLPSLHTENIKPEAAFNRVLGSYRKHAINKNLPFTLTNPEFNALVTNNCYYCGASPQNVQKSTSGHSILIYSGVDRKNSNEGYTVLNCVPCCMVCNWMKNTDSVYNFIRHARKIADHTRGFNG